MTIQPTYMRFVRVSPFFVATKTAVSVPLFCRYEKVAYSENSHITGLYCYIKLIKWEALFHLLPFNRCLTVVLSSKKGLTQKILICIVKLPFLTLTIILTIICLDLVSGR